MVTNSKYESRDVIRARIINTTLELLLTHSPGDLTLRQIAASAGCHHPDIPTYFGGKAGLYREVFLHAVATMAARGLPQTFDKPSSTLTRLIRLAAWLEDDDSGYLASVDARSLFDVLTETYVKRFNLSTDTARLLVQRLMALVIAAVLHPKSIGLREHPFAEHFALETHIAELLAQNHANAAPLDSRGN